MKSVEKDTPKYKKKKNSSKSKSNMKSKHKHEYEPCLFEVGIKGFRERWIHKGKYCKICGKAEIGFFETKPSENIPGALTMLTPEETLERNKDLRLFKVPDYFTKFVEVIKE